MNKKLVAITPLRISLFGGGTDFPEYYGQPDKFSNIISFSCGFKTYLFMKEVSEVFDYNYKVAWRSVELSNEIDQILHPFVKAALQTESLNINSLEVGCHSDLPSRTGLGSSASFAIGLINGLTRLKGREISSESAVNQAFDIERYKIGHFGGIQDQIACQYGGFNHIEIGIDGFTVNSKFCSNELKNQIINRSWLIPVSNARDASRIEVSKFQDLTKVTAELDKISEISERALGFFQANDYRSISELLTKSWMVKRNLSQDVSNTNIDKIVDICIQCDCDGVKLLGAGGGGFVYVLASKSVINNIQKKLKQEYLLQEKNILSVSLDEKGSQICELA